MSLHAKEINSLFTPEQQKQIRLALLQREITLDERNESLKGIARLPEEIAEDEQKTKITTDMLELFNTARQIAKQSPERTDAEIVRDLKAL